MEEIAPGDQVRITDFGLAKQLDGSSDLTVTGHLPVPRVLEGSDGALYGTTKQGGSRGGVLDSAGISTLGNGTVFKVNKDGSGYAVLRRFTGADGDGVEPWSGLAEGRAGALYGATREEGIEHHGLFGFGFGTVFKLNKDGSGYQVLHSFGRRGNESQGHTPAASLLPGSDGLLYGTTVGGGSGPGRNGTAFKMKTDGTGHSVLHSFSDRRYDGRTPRARLVEGSDGALYGTTEHGGTNDHGTIFRLTKDGSGYKDNVGTVFKLYLPRPSPGRVVK